MAMPRNQDLRSIDSGFADWLRPLATYEGQISLVALCKMAGCMGLLDNTSQQEVATLKSDVKWIKQIGGAIGSAIFLLVIGALGYLVQFEIPRQTREVSNTISAQLPNNFGERFSKLEQKVDDLQTRYGALTPSSLQTLIPTPGQKLAANELRARLQRANGVIAAAYDLDLPGDPPWLSRLRERLDLIQTEYSGTPTVVPAVMSTQAYLSSYSLFSTGAYGTNFSLHKPNSSATEGIDVNQTDVQRSNGVGSISNLTLRCMYPTAGGIAGEISAISNFLVFQVRIQNCQQRQLGYFTWIRTEFDHATVMYHGGPLTLVHSSFKDCTFEFGEDPNSQEALAIIGKSAGKPVDIYLR